MGMLDSLIPALPSDGYLSTIQAAVKDISADLPIERQARAVVDLAIETVTDTAREVYDALLEDSGAMDEMADPELVAGLLTRALASARAFYVEEVETLLGPHGKGWRDSGPRTLADCYGIMHAACRRAALDALSGPDADGIFPQAFVERYNRAAAAREGGF